MPEIWSALARTLFAFALLAVIAYLAGWRQVARLTFFDITLAVAVGGVAALLAGAANLKIWPLVMALLALGALVYARGKINLAVLPLRKILPPFPWLEGKMENVTPEGPQELVVEGRLVAHPRHEYWLTMQLEERGIHTMDEVEYVVLGSNGKLYVDKREITGGKPYNQKKRGD